MLLFQKMLICAVFLLYVCKSAHPAHCFFLCICLWHSHFKSDKLIQISDERITFFTWKVFF